MATINSTTGWQQKNTITFDNSGSGVSQTDFVMYISHKLGDNNMANIIPLSFYEGVNRASLDGKDIRLTSDSAGNNELPLHLITHNGLVDSGSNTSTTLFQLRDSTQNFNTTVKVGDRVFNKPANTTALVTSVDSNIQLTLNADIFPVAGGTGKSYLLVRFYCATKNTIGVANTSVYLWCGNSNATLPAVTDTYGRNNVYNAVANPYLANWSLDESTTGDSATDSTGNGWLGTSGGTNKPSSIDSVFYQGQYFSGNNGTPAVEDRFNIANSNVANFEGQGTSPPTAFTIKCWFIASGSTGLTQALLSKRTNSGTYKGYEIQIANSPKKLTFAVDMGTSRVILSGITTLSTSTPYLLVVTVPTSGIPTEYTMTLNGVNEVSTYQILDAPIDSGTTTSTLANHLVQSGQNFITTVIIGDVVANTTASPNTFAKVTAVNSNTDLTLSADITPTGQAFSIFRNGNLSNGENVGIGSRNGGASVSPYEGTMELVTYINNVQMSTSWAIAHYNNITSMGTLLIASANAVFNQFPADYNLIFKSVCRSLPTYIGSTQSNYISLISELQVQNTSFWNYVQNGGGNIVICTNVDGTGRIPIDIASCDTSTKTLSIFIKRTITFGGGDYIYIFFRVTNANLVYQPHFDNTNGRNETYSHANYKLVMHLNETGSGVAGEYKDSTGTLNDGQGTVAPNLVDAVIGKGQQGNATTMKISIGNIGFPYGKAAGTMSAWAIFTGDTSEQTTLAYGNDGNGERRVLQQRSDGCGGHVSGAFWGVSRLYSGKTHVAWLFPTDAGTLTVNETRIFINGVEMLTSGVGDQQLKLLVGTNLTVNTIDNYKQLLKGGGGAFANVPMDEMRLTTNELSADWIKLDYFNQLLTTNLWQGAEILNLVGSLAPSLKGGLQ